MKYLDSHSAVTGLSDDELALILEVSKGSMYNSKRNIRPLPTAALLKLAQLEIDRMDPEKVEVATRKLRETELQKLDVLIKYRQAHMHKLGTIISNKEIKLENMKHHLKKKLRALVSRSLALKINENANAHETLLQLQKDDLANSTARFHENGPAKLVELTLDIERLKMEQTVTTAQVEQLLLTAKQINELPVAEWPLLLNAAG